MASERSTDVQALRMLTAERAAVSNLQKHPQCLRKYSPDGLQ